MSNQRRRERPHRERPRRAGPGLAALATAAFVYVTAETLPVGLLPQLSAGLHVRPGAVGLLVTIYAAVAGLMAVPVTVLTGRLPRRQVVVGSVALLALSQLAMALAPNYPVVLAARVGCAFAHGVFWSVLAPVAGRLAAPGRAGRATAIVFTGRSLVAVCAVTVLLVTAHFIPYTYIAALVRHDAGLTGLALSAVLLVYGVAGVAGIGLTGWATDRRPRLAAAGCAVTLTVALAVMAAVAPGSAVFTVAAVAAWGAAFAALPVALPSAVLRVAPRSADTASALYVVTFQIGIGGGALAGSVLVDNGLLGQLPVVGLVFAAAGTVLLLAARRAFPSRSCHPSVPAGSGPPARQAPEPADAAPPGQELATGR